MRTTPYRILVLLVSLAVLAVACGDDGDDDGDDGDGAEAPSATEAATSSTAPPTTETIPETGDALVELQITAVSFGDDGAVTVRNVGADDAAVGGLFICQFPTYVDLGTLVDGGVIPAGGTAEIAGAAVGGLDEAGGEAALYVDNTDFGSSDNILAFVQWGSGGARGGVAAEAGIWPGADVTVTPDPEFGAIELFGDPADPASWG